MGDDLFTIHGQHPDSLVDHTAHCSAGILSGDLKIRQSYEAQEPNAGWTAPSKWTTKHVHRCFLRESERVPDLLVEVPEPSAEADSEAAETIVNEEFDDQPQADVLGVAHPLVGDAQVQPGDDQKEAEPEEDGELMLGTEQSYPAVAHVSYLLWCAWVMISRPQLTARCVNTALWRQIRDELEGCARALPMCSPRLVMIGWSALVNVLDAIKIDELAQRNVMHEIEALQAELRDFDYTNCTTTAYDAAYYLDGTLVALYDALRRKRHVVIPHLYRITVHVEYRALKLMLSCLSTYPTAEPRHQSSTNTPYTGDRTTPSG